MLASRPSRRLVVVLLLVVAAACGPRATGRPDGDAGTDGGHPNEGLAVGSTCTMDSQCDSPTTPACLTELKPLSSLAGVPAELADIGLVFPEGYCSSVLSCTGDGDCGDRGKCYRPFREVTAETLRALEEPLMVTAGSLDFLPSYGVCLRACAGVTECETGQLCEKPTAELVALVPGSINDVDFCVPDPACAEGGCTSGGDRVIGQSCTADDQCKVPGTPRCLTEIHPLEDVLPPTEFLSQVGLDFARGYCSNMPTCAANIQCGPHGKCLAPFREVTAEALRDLERIFDPPLAPGTFDFLAGYGVCLRSCADSFECFADQACQLVMSEFISQVPGSINVDTFCVPHEDCRYCNSHAHCEVDAANHGACVCNPGYSGNGLNCAATGQPACAASPCQHGGTCTDGPDSTYTCACAEGYRGTNCQIAIACTPEPCQHGGTCTPTGPNSHTCACPPGYSGPNCETESLCPNLGPPAHGEILVTSQGPGGTATYECDSGYALSGNATRTCQANGSWTGTAPTCVAVVDPCASHPCLHGGVCTPGTGSSFTCSCDGTGYTGDTCATPVDCGGLTAPSHGSITTAPPSSTTFGTTATYACMSGYALSGNATRTCQASGAWTGTAPTCVAQTSPCTPNPCQNGGTCTVTGTTTYSCACADGYTGTNCQTPHDCGALTAPSHGSVTAASTTLGATATYACDSGYGLSGSATRTCQSSGWSGAAPTCVASSCGTYTDIVYRLTGTFDIRGTSFGAGDQTFTGLTSNAATPPFVSNTNMTPFTGNGTFARGFARLRFTNDGNGHPIAGTVRLVEMYMPLEFTQTHGATLYANNDHSLGILANPGALSNCGGGDSTCTSHAPSVDRQCASNATGSLSGTTLTWGSCTPAWTGANSWSYASSARSATGPGCATGYVQFGNNTTSSILVPQSGKGDLYQVYNQQLASITFSSTDYATATWRMADIQIPNGTGQSNTWLTITNASPIGTDCGTTAGVDLVCNLQ